MAINQSQSQNSSRSQTATSSSKPQSSSSSSQSSSTSTPSASSSLNTSSGSTSSASSNVDMVEQTIAKGVSHLLQTLEPQLNRIGTQIVNRVMSRGQDIADTGVKRMQDQPWYMVGGALALVAVGVGLLFAFEGNSSGSPDYSTNVQ